MLLDGGEGVFSSNEIRLGIAVTARAAASSQSGGKKWPSSVNHFIAVRASWYSYYILRFAPVLGGHDSAIL